MLAPGRELHPAPLLAPTPQVANRVLDFFTARIPNDHTRRAYWMAARRFSGWCEARGIVRLEAVEPFHVAAFLKEMEGTSSPPTVKQHLSALRRLFDWLVVGQVLKANPAHAVRGPRYLVRKGKTPVLTGEEARRLLNSIETIRTRKHPDGSESAEPSLIGLRDRALIGVMVYAFARIGAVLKMQVRDYFIQGRRGWVRLHEKGGREHEVPCHHNLEGYLEAYLEASGIGGDAEGPLFRTVAGRRGALTGRPLWQQDAYRMVQRRARAAGIGTRVNNHTFRATGITAYLKNRGTLEVAQQIVGHASPRTTKLYDRRREEITLDEVERIAI